MSIFYCQDIDNVLFEHLFAEDLKNLSMVNRYYHSIINNQYNDLFDFFRTINNINISSFSKYDPKYTVLLKSIVFGKIFVCEYLIKKNKYDMNIHNEFPFRAAVLCGHKHIAEYLLCYVKDINDSYINDVLQSAFNYAVKYGHEDIEKMLINNSKFDTRKYHRLIPDIFSHCSLGTAELFCSSGEINCSKSALMMHACSNKDTNVAKYVYTKYNLYFDNNFVDCAALIGNTETVKWLMTFGQWNALDATTLIPIFRSALINNDDDIVKGILTNEIIDNSGINMILDLLYICNEHNKSEMIEFIIDNNNVYKHANLLFNTFLQHHEYRCMKYLLTKQPKIQYNRGFNIGPILELCNDDPDLVELIVKCCDFIKIERNADGKISQIHFTINL